MGPLSPLKSALYRRAAENQPELLPRPTYPGPASPPPTSPLRWYSLDLAELVTVAEDQIHVLVESLEGADEDAAVLQDAPHPVVDVLQHLAALAHRLQNATRSVSCSSGACTPPGPH